MAAMLPENIELEVVTPQKHVLRDSVQSVEMPGKDGYLGILPGHAPLLTELGIGVLTYQKGAQTRRLTVINGYAEVLAEHVTVLAELSESAEEIDVARVTSARQRAEAELAKAGSGSAEMDWQVASLALQRALVRLQVAGKK
jgi:F-type H+-transporting ATPase subunit epsilon